MRKMFGKKIKSVLAIGIAAGFVLGAAGLATAKYVLSEKIDAIILRRIGEIAFHALRDGYVEIYLTDGKTAKQVIDNFARNKLKKLSKPTHLSDK